MASAAANREYQVAIQIAAQVQKSVYDSFNLIDKQFSGISKAASAAFDVGVQAATAFAGAVTGIASAAVAVGAPFEAQMSSVQAITMATDQELAALTEKAKEMGATTAFSATEAGEAMEYMAMAGWKTEQMIDGIDGIMNLAAASGEDLATTSDIVTDALTAFGMQAAESARFADILAAASSNANTNVSMLGESFKYCAPLAGSLGFSAEDTAIALSLMANSGVKASMAGTSFRSAITNLVKPTDNMAAMMDRLGISVTKENGDMKTLKEIMDMLRETMKSMTEEEQLANLAMLEGSDAMQLAQEQMKGLSEDEVYFTTAFELGKEAVQAYTEAELNAVLSTEYSKVEIKEMSEEMKRNQVAIMKGEQQLSGLSKAQQANAAATIFGKQALSGWLAVVNASEEDYQKLTKAIYESEGAAKEMADIRLNNLLGDVTILKSGMEALGNQIYDEIKGPLRAATQWATGAVARIATDLKNSNFLGNLIGSIEKGIPTAVRHLKDFGSAIMEFAKPLFSVGNWLLQHPDIIVSTIAGIGAAIATYRVAEGISNLVKGFQSLGAVLTNPYAMAIMGVAAAIGGATGIIASIKQAEEAMKQQNLAQHFGEISLSLEELHQVANSIIDTGSFRELDAAMASMETIKGLEQGIDKTVAELNKTHWKVSIGMELDETESQNYLNQIQTYISQAQELFTEQQYAIGLSVEVLTKDDEKGQGIRESFNNYFNNKQQELASLGKELQKVVNKGFNDGLLEIDQEKVAELQRQMAEITNNMAKSEFDAKLEVIGLKFSGTDLTPESFQDLQRQLQQAADGRVIELDNALEAAISNVNLQLKDGAIDAKEATEQIKEFKKNYLEEVGEVQLRVANFNLNTIKEGYEEEIAKLGPEVGEKLEQVLSDAFNRIETDPNAPVLGLFDGIEQEFSKIEGLSKDTKNALAELFEGIKPNLDTLVNLREQYRQYGIEPIEGLNEGITDVAAWGILTGNIDALHAAISGMTEDNAKWTQTLQKMQEDGKYVPEYLARGIEEGRPKLTEQVQKEREFLNSEYNRIFESPMAVSVMVDVTAKYNIKNPDIPIGKGGELRANADLKQSIAGYRAEGGIITKPELSWIGEAGPEAVVPLDGSSHAVQLWQEAGQLLGVLPEVGTAARVEPNWFREGRPEAAGVSQEIIEQNNRFSFSNPNNVGRFSELASRLSQVTTNQQTYYGGNKQIGDINITMQFHGDTNKKEVEQAGEQLEEKIRDVIEKVLRQKDREQSLKFS